MSGSLGVIPEARLTPIRMRRTDGGGVGVYFQLVSLATGDLISGATGLSARYWPPGTAYDAASAQPVTPVQISAGTWLVIVPDPEWYATTIVRMSVTSPVTQTAEASFDPAALEAAEQRANALVLDLNREIAAIVGTDAAAALVQQRIAELNASVEDALLPVATLAQLNTVEGTREGQRAEVYADPDPAKNGIYRWSVSGDAWVYSGLSTQTLTSKVAQQETSLQALDTTVSSQGDTLTQHGNSLTALEQTTSNQGEAITGLGQTVTAQGTTLGEHGQSLQDLDQRTAQQESSLQALDSTVSGQGQTLTQQGEAIDTLGQAVTSQGETLTEQGGAITAQGQAIEDRKQEIQRIGIEQDAELPGYGLVLQDGDDFPALTISDDGRETMLGALYGRLSLDGVFRFGSWVSGGGIDFLPDKSFRHDVMEAAPDGLTAYADDIGSVSFLDRRDGIIDSWRVDAPNRARPSLLLSRRPIDRGLIAIGANQTVHTTWCLEADFDLVRVAYENDTSTSYSVTKAFVAPSAIVPAEADGYQPRDGGGAATAFTPITFDGAGADLGPPAGGGSVTTVTVPGISAGQVKAYAFSDWLRVSALPAVGGGQLRYLVTRTHFADGGRGQRWPNMDAAVTSPYGGGRFGKGVLAAGDFATGAFPTPFNAGWAVPGILQYYARGRGATILNLGDSISQGTGSVGDVCSWAHLAAMQLSRPGRPVSVCSGGWGGQASIDFWRRSRQEIDLFRPPVVTIATFSPNDSTPTQASVDASFSRALDLAEYAVSQGVVPILLTPIPLNTLNATTDGFRQQVVARVRALGSQGGMLVLDADAAVTDGASPARIRAEYAADTTHLNDAGQRTVARRFVPLLTQALGY